MSAMRQNVSQHLLCQRGYKMFHNLYWLNPTLPARTQNSSQHVLKPLPCPRGLKIYLNICWPNPRPHSSEDTKYISTFVERTTPMPTTTQNVSQHVLTKIIPSQRELKLYVNLCWPKVSHDSEDTKWIWTCVEQTHPMSVRTQNASNMCRPNHFHDNEITICI